MKMVTRMLSTSGVRMAAIILDFEEFKKKKQAEKERAENKRLYAIIEKNIAHLLPKKTEN